MTEISTIYAKRDISAMHNLHSCRNKDYGKVKFNTTNLFNHELSKCIVSWNLIKANHEIVTEAIFNNGKRADVYDLTTNIVYELLNTEKIANIDLKQTKYPAPIIPISCKDLRLGTIEALENSFIKRLEI